MKKFEKFIKLPFSLKVLYFKVFLELLVFKLLLNVLSFENFKKVISFLLKKSSAKKQLTQNEIRKFALIINRISNTKPFIFTCLPKAITMMFNCRMNKQVKLRIGVRTTESNTFEFHAWVETDNEVLIGEIKEITFVPLWTWN